MSKSRRFPVFTYRDEIRVETTLPDTYWLQCIGTPEPDIECLYVKREQKIEDGDETVFFLQMNADERFLQSDSTSETRDCYEFYNNNNEDPFYTCNRIDVAEKKWFTLIAERVEHGEE